MRNPSAVQTTLPVPEVKRDRGGSWGHAAGRTWCLERGLLGRSGFERLYSAKTADDIRRILLEHHYPQKPTLSAMLTAEYEAVYAFLSEVAPEDGFRMALLIRNDVHHLKVFLKESLSGDRARPYDRLSAYLKKPSNIDPEILFEAVRGVDREVAVPSWVNAMILRARSAYDLSYDAGAIDLSCDRDAAEIAAVIAEKLECPWLVALEVMKRDLSNLETLLRVRLRGMSCEQYRQSLLPGGYIEDGAWRSLERADDARIAGCLDGTPYEPLACHIGTYGERGGSVLFLREKDQLIGEHLQSGRRQTTEPERVLSYILTREMEIQSARIAAAMLENGIEGEEAAPYRRGPIC